MFVRESEFIHCTAVFIDDSEVYKMLTSSVLSASSVVFHASAASQLCRFFESFQIRRLIKGYFVNQFVSVG